MRYANSSIMSGLYFVRLSAAQRSRRGLYFYLLMLRKERSFALISKFFSKSVHKSNTFGNGKSTKRLISGYKGLIQRGNQSLFNSQLPSFVISPAIYIRKCNLMEHAIILEFSCCERCEKSNLPRSNLALALAENVNNDQEKSYQLFQVHLANSRSLF